MSPCSLGRGQCVSLAELHETGGGRSATLADVYRLGRGRASRPRAVVGLLLTQVRDVPREKRGKNTRLSKWRKRVGVGREGGCLDLHKETQVVH